MSTVKWIDITSQALREVHQLWCGLRGKALIPHLKDYNNFVVRIEEDASLSAIFPVKNAPPAFRTVGVTVLHDYPSLKDGISFDEIKPIIDRTLLTVPFHEVRSNRQPDCRRGQFGHANRGRTFEQLLLPFGDDRLRVCLVHAIFEFSQAG